MTTANGIVYTLARKPGIATARPARHTAIRQAAESLTRRNVDAATVELLQEALQAATGLLYEADSDGQPANMDHATGRALVPLPWGRAGHSRWGLRPQEANILRRILFDRQAYGPPLYLYDRSRRAWFVNRQDYPTLTHAAKYLRRYAISIAEYRAARVNVLGNG